MQFLGPEPQSRGCQLGSGSVPRAQWFPLTDVPTAPARGREGHSRRKMSRSPPPQTIVACEAHGSWAETPVGHQRAGLADFPLYPKHSTLHMARTPLLPVGPGKAEAAVRIILGRGADLEERIRRKQEEEQARRRAQRPLAGRRNFGFWGHVPRRPALPPTPSPPTSRGVGQSLRQAIKWLPARRAPSREVSSPAGEGRSLDTQNAGTAY